ncbi:HD domain protein [Sporomusa ovata DSM 2662]|uniref:HD protein (Iojap analog?) n=1 Tax=Sporomusa ovata TaxID=2378 RepID=A0A0U1L641_9FIRM|nr:HDIG domain-containing metalloprotein [Sporomusa ovata]EQB24825.1 metal dependent phosphohydrolase [Sporomusa ovata DSM 2662]CQR75172.1 HD protein (Iojap analog?) [Sporomusa ovata]
MNKRVKQVVAALTARINDVDKVFIDKYLNKTQAALFWQMNLPDQRHALNVAYTALKLAAGQAVVNQELLIQCALLHDVGKVKGDVSTADKIITVIFDRFAPQWAKSWGQRGRGSKIDNLRHAVYIYYHHAERGAAMLTAAGLSPELTMLVARHHEAPAVGEPPELTLLKKADSLN